MPRGVPGTAATSPGNAGCQPRFDPSDVAAQTKTRNDHADGLADQRGCERRRDAEPDRRPRAHAGERDRHEDECREREQHCQGARVATALGVRGEEAPFPEFALDLVQLIRDEVDRVVAIPAARQSVEVSC